MRRLGRGSAAGAALGVTGLSFHAGQVNASVPADRFAASGGRGSTRVWWSVETTERAIALTFDDGPTDEFTTPVLDILDRYDAAATFFVIGELAEQRPDTLKAVAARGHEIGNHTYDHRSAEGQDPATVLAKVERGAEAIAAALGDVPRWMRPVKGHVTGSILRAASRVEHDIAIWSLQRGQRGTVGDGDAAAVEAHLLQKVHPGAIVLLHDGIGRSGLDTERSSSRLQQRRRAEVEALPRVLEGWANDGYRFVTLSELTTLET
jgi:peptidoglycan/xylan/chitin deacetylase (PgdA/CDA1 family)